MDSLADPGKIWANFMVFGVNLGKLPWKRISLTFLDHLEAPYQRNYQRSPSHQSTLFWPSPLFTRLVDQRISQAAKWAPEGDISLRQLKWCRTNYNPKVNLPSLRLTWTYQFYALNSSSFQILILMVYRLIDQWNQSCNKNYKFLLSNIRFDVRVRVRYQFFVQSIIEVTRM